jgi:hypothetical protein
VVRSNDVVTIGLIAAVALGTLGCRPSLADDNSTVYLCRTERILVPPGWSSPQMLYPQGRIDARQVAGLLEAGIRAYTGLSEPLDNPWRQIATPQDKVGIQVDLLTPPVSRQTINAIIDALVNSGISPDNIIVYTGNESELFAAGISVNPIGRGIRTMGSESEGYRGGVSRILLDHCTVIINVARLRADRELGVRGCVANCLSIVPYVDRVRLLANPAHLPGPAAHPLMRQKARLHVLEAYQPLLEDTGEQFPPVWEYRGLLMSSDPVALDLIGLRILAAKQAQTRQAAGHERLVAAEKALDYLVPAGSRMYRLGHANPDNIDLQVIGTDKDLLIDMQPTPKQ